MTPERGCPPVGVKFAHGFVIRVRVRAAHGAVYVRIRVRVRAAHESGSESELHTDPGAMQTDLEKTTRWHTNAACTNGVQTAHHTNARTQEIYMTVPNMPGEVMLLVDWDAGNVDVKLGVFPHPGTNDKAYELTIRCVRVSGMRG
eukprot:365609-Chlamydomonas_euryale.AAC.5